MDYNTSQCNKHGTTIISTTASENSCCIEDLPTEILLRIFSFLSPEDLAKGALRACKHWNVIGLDPSLWTRLHFKRRNLINENMDSELLIIRNASKHLLSFECNNTEYGSEILKVICECNHSLTEFKMMFSRLSTDHLIKRLIACCSNLSSINLEGMKVDSSCEDSCCKSFSIMNNKSLTHINLSNCMWVNDLFIDELSSSESKIKYLNIEANYYLSDKAIANFVECKGQDLQSFIIDGERIGKETFSKISHCRGLTQFSSQFSENLIDSVFATFCSLEFLESLIIRKGYGLSVFGLPNAFKTKEKFNTITCLKLMECYDLTDVTVEVIALRCPNLKSFSLDWCLGISDIGLVNVINHCQKIQILSLIGACKITEKVFENVPPKCPDLHYLDLLQCDLIDDMSVLQLIKKNPNLVIKNYWGVVYDYNHDGVKSL